MAKNCKEIIIKDTSREFYANIDEIRNMYICEGYIRQKTLYLTLQSKYNWKMSYSTFTRYFNKEIKIKEAKKSNTKEIEIIVF